MFDYQKVTFQQAAARVLRMPQTISTAHSQYRIESAVNFDVASGQIGSSQALVYAGRELASGKRVAVKQLLSPGDADACERHRRECLFLLSSAKHPNIVNAYDEIQDGAERFLVLEWLDGEPVGGEISGGGPVPPHIVRARLGDLCRVLTFVHAAGWLFRDLNENNVFVDGPGSPRVTVLDFGGIVPCGSSRPTRLMPPSPAPECRQAFQSARKSAFSPSSDVYAAAALAYYMATGQTVPDDRSGAPLAPPDALVPGFDAQLSAAIMAGLDPDAGRRPASAVEFRHLVEGAAPAAHQAAASHPPPNRANTKLPDAALKGLLLLVAAFAALGSLAMLVGGSHGVKRGGEMGATPLSTAARTISLPGAAPRTKAGQPTATVLVEGVNVRLRTGPSLSAAVIGEMSWPDRVIVLGHSGGWVRVALDRNTQGYVWGAFVQDTAGYAAGQVIKRIDFPNYRFDPGDRVLLIGRDGPHILALMPDGGECEFDATTVRLIKSDAHTSIERTKS